MFTTKESKMSLGHRIKGLGALKRSERNYKGCVKGFKTRKILLN